MGQQKQILVVEDEFLIAIHVADIMADLGFGVIGPAGNIQQALALIDEGRLDGAILDVNLSGQLVFPVASALAARNVPFILTSGYDVAGLPAEWRDRPVLRKPVAERDLARLAQSVFLAETGEMMKVAGVGQA
jgi:DNA-binding response OmpR family regulator